MASGREVLGSLAEVLPSGLAGVIDALSTRIPDWDSFAREILRDSVYVCMVDSDDPNAQAMLLLGQDQDLVDSVFSRQASHYIAVVGLVLLEQTAPFGFSARLAGALSGLKRSRNGAGTSQQKSV
jgi:hypothetical protein